MIMKNKEAGGTTISQNVNTEYVPFVNEECGDTMWDEVLKEAEDRIRKEEWNSGLTVSV